MDKKDKFIQINVQGKDAKLWHKLKSKFILAVEKSLDTVINHEDNATIKDEAKNFSTALIKHAKAKLAKTGIENEKLLAEIEVAYSQKTKELAQARKINAEADAIEFNNAVKNLKLSLIGMKTIMIGDASQEDIVFIKQVDFFLDAITNLEKDLQ